MGTGDRLAVGFSVIAHDCDGYGNDRSRDFTNGKDTMPFRLTWG